MATSWDKSCGFILIQIHPRHKKEIKKRIYCRILLVGDEILKDAKQAGGGKYSYFTDLGRVHCGKRLKNTPRII